MIETKQKEGKMMILHRDFKTRAHRNKAGTTVVVYKETALFEEGEPQRVIQ